MATSHFCKGKWRSGSVEACPRHEKLARPQSNVYRGVGDPGGRSGSSSKPESEPKQSESAPKKSDASAASAKTASTSPSSTSKPSAPPSDG